MNVAKLSKWTVEGRLERFKQKISESRLSTLKAKRIRQLKKLIEKYKSINPKKSRRFEARFYYLGGNS